MAIKIVLFNHKGGVSKTTTAYNLGWMLASMQKRVLLVDADPQCNLTSLLLQDDFDEYYLNDKTKAQNIKDGVSPVFKSQLKPIEAVSCFSPEANPNLFLLVGHADLSEYDAALSFAQTSNNAFTALENLLGAFNELIEKTAAYYEIDLVLIDLNSSLSAINQNLFISSDMFVVPTNPDPFSIMAIHTLAKILPRWVEWANRSRPLLADAVYPLADTQPRFAGVIIQCFNIRNGQVAKLYKDNINQIKHAINHDFIPKIKNIDMLFSNEEYQEINIDTDYCLLELKDFQNLLLKAHAAGVPVFALTDEQIGETGAVLKGLKTNRDNFKEQFKLLAEKVIGLSKHAKRNQPVSQ